MTQNETNPNLVRLGLVQMQCVDAKPANVDRALARIAEAAQRGAQMICLPELFAGLYPCQSEDHRHFDEAEPIPGPTSEVLCRGRTAARSRRGRLAL